MGFVVHFGGVDDGCLEFGGDDAGVGVSLDLYTAARVCAFQTIFSIQGGFDQRAQLLYEEVVHDVWVAESGGGYLEAGPEVPLVLGRTDGVDGLIIIIKVSILGGFGDEEEAEAVAVAAQPRADFGGNAEMGEADADDLAAQFIDVGCPIAATFGVGVNDQGCCLRRRQGRLRGFRG